MNAKKDDSEGSSSGRRDASFAGPTDDLTRRVSMEDIAVAMATEAAQLEAERAARLVHQAPTLPPPPPTDDTSGEVPLGTTVVGTSDAPPHGVDERGRAAAGGTGRKAASGGTARFDAAIVAPPWTPLERALAIALVAAIVALIALALAR